MKGESGSLSQSLGRDYALIATVSARLTSVAGQFISIQTFQSVVFVAIVIAKSARSAFFFQRITMRPNLGSSAAGVNRCTTQVRSAAVARDRCTTVPPVRGGVGSSGPASPFLFFYGRVADASEGCKSRLADASPQ